MMAKLHIYMDNAAFDDAPASELGRILRDLADRVDYGELPPLGLQDSNGNTVGKFEIES